MSERRSRDRIVFEILSICTEGENITKVVYRANTNFVTVRAYMNLLIGKDLIEILDGPPVRYKTTPKGMTMRNKLKVLQEKLEKISS